MLSLIMVRTTLLHVLLDNVGLQRKSNVIRTRHGFWALTSCYDNDTFRSDFRQTRSSFSPFIEKVRNSVEIDKAMARRSSANAISAEVRVGVMLRIMASSSFLDLMMMFGLLRTIIYEYFETCMHANI